MNADKQHLICDLLQPEDGNLRAATLQAAGKLLRHRRRWRMIRASGATLAVIFAGLVALVHFASVKPPEQTQQASSKPPGVRPPRMRSLTDDELLGLFPETPVALVKLVDGTKKLVFLRPGDEARFMTRL